ncbi:hypothetical protein tyrosine phosphatase [Acidovorax sp. CF316]|nr:hypothetical protein tyrosine phosphatase [Acidovorax sp. CF316]
MPPDPQRDKNWKLLYRQAVQRARAPIPNQAAIIGELLPGQPQRDRLGQPALQPEQRLQVLFICSRNQWRSPTAEKVWRNHPQLSVRSAGTSPNARHPVSERDLQWAQAIFVMEEKHKSRLLAEFGSVLAHKPIHVLDIPDEYQYMDPDLVAELERSVGAILGIDGDTTP